LQQIGLDVTVYEGDNADILDEEEIAGDSREPAKRNKLGYGLTLTYCNGKGPLHSLGVMDQCIAQDTPSLFHWLFDGSGNVLGYYGHHFVDELASTLSSSTRDKAAAAVDAKDAKQSFSRGNLRIPRSVLRKMLYNTLKDKESSVCFNKSLVQIEERLDCVALFFKDGETAFCDICIGADGICSLARCHRDASFKQLSLAVANPCPETECARYGTKMTSSYIYPNEKYRQYIDAMCASNAAYGLRYLGISVIIGVSSFVPPAGLGVDLVTDGGFYMVDGVNRLFVMPYQDTRGNLESGLKRPQLTMWQLSFSGLSESDGLRMKYPFARGPFAPDFDNEKCYFDAQCSNYRAEAIRRLIRSTDTDPTSNGSVTSSTTSALQETMLGLVMNTDPCQVRVCCLYL
jgi:hypothetical protein